jgi:hypothetical protein
MPRDDGHLILSQEERDSVLQREPQLEPWMRLFLGAHELINNQQRYCLWLVGVPPHLLAQSALLRTRLKAVQEFRQRSKAESTRRFAATPSLFCQIAQPEGEYVLVPRHSSENRRFIPMAFFGQENIVADSCLSVGGATLFHFGILSSTMHNAWVRYTCGRLKSDYRYSEDIVYNNFPWPESPTDAQRAAIESAAQTVLDTRAQFPGSTLADLYDPLTMPPALLKAHPRSSTRRSMPPTAARASRPTPNARPSCSSCTSASRRCCQRPLRRSDHASMPPSDRRPRRV